MAFHVSKKKMTRGVRFLGLKSIYLLNNRATPGWGRDMNGNSDAELYRNCIEIDSAESGPHPFNLLGLCPHRAGTAPANNV